MTEKKSYISTINYSNYGYFTGAGHISLHANGVTSTLQLTKEEVAELEALAWKFFTNRKEEMLQELAVMKPPALLAHDIGDKVIEYETETEPATLKPTTLPEL